MFSGLPPIAYIVQRGWRGREVPTTVARIRPWHPKLEVRAEHAPATFGFRRGDQRASVSRGPRYVRSSSVDVSEVPNPDIQRFLVGSATSRVKRRQAVQEGHAAGIGNRPRTATRPGGKRTWARSTRTP